MATRTLDSAPSILPLYARAAAPLIPGASLLPFVPGRGKEIPDTELVLPAVRPIGLEEELKLSVRPTPLQPHSRGRTFGLLTEAWAGRQKAWESVSTMLRRGDAEQPADGMWTKARCLAALEGRLPEAFAVDVRFRKPILLPGRVEFRSGREGEEIDFAVRDPKRQTPHLNGRTRST